MLSYTPEVMPTPRQPFINERSQVEPEPEVVPVEVQEAEELPPRRFPSLASIEPAEEEPQHSRYGHAAPHHTPAHAEPAYEDKIEEPAAPAHRPQHDSGLPLEDDDLDVPAFIRRKVE